MPCSHVPLLHGRAAQAIAALHLLRSAVGEIRGAARIVRAGAPRGAGVAPYHLGAATPRRAVGGEGGDGGRKHPHARRQQTQTEGEGGQLPCCGAGQLASRFEDLARRPGKAAADSVRFCNGIVVAVFDRVHTRRFTVGIRRVPASHQADNSDGSNQRQKDEQEEVSGS